MRFAPKTQPRTARRFVSIRSGIALSRPTSSYWVCGLPRSGSSFLCGLRERWGLSGEREYLEGMLEAGTAGGVFAAKVMRGYFAEVLDRLRAFAGDPGLTDLEALESFAAG